MYDGQMAVEASKMNGFFGLIGQMMSNYRARRENQKARAYNLYLAQLQNQYNIDQWNRENAYNHPVRQRQRLEEAGFNPNLAFSNGLQNIAASSPDLTAGAPATPAPAGYNFGSVADMMLVQSQVAKNYAEAESAEGSARQSNATADNILAMTPQQVKALGITNEMNQKLVQKVVEDIELVKSQKEYVDTQNNAQKIQNYIQACSVEDIIANYRNIAAQTAANTRYMNAQALGFEQVNKVRAAAMKDPEGFQSLVNELVNKGKLSDEQVIEFVAKNTKEGNYIANNANGVGKWSLGFLGLALGYFSQFIPKI